MNKIPAPILSFIFTMVGPFPEYYCLILVCKNWKKVIESSFHLVTFQRSAKKSLQPGNNEKLIRDVLLEKFSISSNRIPLKLLSLDLRNVSIDEKALSDIIISQPRLLKLNLINCNINLAFLWKITYDKARELPENHDTFNHSLEDLRISNYLFQYNLKYIAIIFRNLKKLYAGNTNTSFNDFKFIIKYFKELEILDLSYCNQLIEDISNLSELDINLLGEIRRLKIIFMTGPSLILEEALSNLGVKVIKNNIIEILNEIENDEDLEKLNEWLSLGGEINTDMGLSKGSKFYPQINLIKRPLSEELLIKAYKLMVNYDLDIYIHDSQKKCNSNIFGNFICAADINGKVNLFNYFIENSFPIVKCYNHPNILISSPKFLDVIINPQIQNKPKIPIEILYEAAQFFILNKNQIKAMAIIDYLLQLNFNEKEVLSKIEGSVLLDRHGHKSLMSLAAENSLKNILNKLISNNFDINIQDKYGGTALIYSSECGNENILSFLCENGADIHKKTGLGRTALHLAAQNGHVNVVRELISLGSELSPACEMGYTPLDLADRNKNILVSELLRKFGARKNNKSRKKRCELY